MEITINKPAAHSEKNKKKSSFKVVDCSWTWTSWFSKQQHLFHRPHPAGRLVYHLPDGAEAAFAEQRLSTGRFLVIRTQTSRARLIQQKRLERLFPLYLLQEVVTEVHLQRGHRLLDPGGRTAPEVVRRSIYHRRRAFCRAAARLRSVPPTADRSTDARETRHQIGVTEIGSRAINEMAVVDLLARPLWLFTLDECKLPTTCNKGCILKGALPERKRSLDRARHA